MYDHPLRKGGDISKFAISLLSLSFLSPGFDQTTELDILGWSRSHLRELREVFFMPFSIQLMLCSLRAALGCGAN